MKLEHHTKKVRIVLRDWHQVERLCARRQRGVVKLQIRARGFMPGEELRADLVLPNGFRARVGARVTKLSRDPFGDTRELPELTVELVGLSCQVAERLMALAKPAESSQPRVSPAREAERVPPIPPRNPRVADGTPRPERIDAAQPPAHSAAASELINEWEGSSWEELMLRVCGRMRVSELLVSNRHLRTQIESLADRMRPRR